MRLYIAMTAISLILLAGPSPAADSQPAPEWTRNVADRFANGRTDIVAAVLTGKFNSFDLLANTLDVRAIVASDGKKPILLRQILHSVDFNANGNVATWRVVGPKQLITTYVEQMRKGYQTHEFFYDFDAKTFPATICCNN
jgi:hypothetical protein